MNPIGNILADDLDELVVRQTGMTVAQWEAEWKNRRIEAFKKRLINGVRIYDRESQTVEMRRLDLEPGDFEAVLGILAYPTEMVSVAPHLRRLPRVHIAESEWYHIRQGFTDRASTDSKQPPAKTVVRYRLRQECLRRIAQEAHGPSVQQLSLVDSQATTE